MSVTTTHLTITSRASDSNKCPLKVTLIETAQGNPTTIENTDDSIIEMLITDYITQNHEFTIYVVFSHTNPRDIESEPFVKRKRFEEIDQLIDVDFINTNDNYKSETLEANSVKTSQEKPEKPIKKPKSIKNSTRPPIKERPIRTTCGPKKSRHTTVEDAESDKE
ncbi:hypothetical protein C2G38_2285474 [Gigaspora rosea]|uniref:Uncharacterized protein n=1 Tax=Gigaspora rosea TaxID=44941 RepID=A0A397U4S1_9GLOM|nr:hypothetical protein C2G38_2285474 [Gigaspora rosea]